MTGEVSTGAFAPFGTTHGKGEMIKGRIPCNGAVLKVNPAGANLGLLPGGFVILSALPSPRRGNCSSPITAMTNGAVGRYLVPATLCGK